MVAFVRRHVVKDLRPYSCTFRDCATGGQLYDSSKDWLHHEAQQHEADMNHRFCPFCFADASTQHIAEHLIRIALFALPRSTGLESDGDEGGSADAQLDIGSRDSTSSSLVFSSLYDSGGEIDEMKPRIPGTLLTNDALKTLSEERLDTSLEERLLDYPNSDQIGSTDVQLDLESRDSTSSSLVFPSHYDSGGEIDKMKPRIPRTVLTNDALKTLPVEKLGTSLEERVLDNLNSDKVSGFDVNSLRREHFNLQGLAPYSNRANEISTMLHQWEKDFQRISETATRNSEQKLKRGTTTTTNPSTHNDAAKSDPRSTSLDLATLEPDSKSSRD
ncbi:MAG: hypothetical protein Q9171_003545 [Xanthocarpia ochracea]